MKMGYHKPESRNEYRDPIQLLLIKRQNDIFKTLGYKRSIKYIAEKAIELGLETKAIDSNDIILKMTKRKLREDICKKAGVPIEIYENDSYNLVVEKQKEIFDATGNIETIKEIMERYIKLEIELVR